MPNKLLLFVLVIFILSGLAFKPALAKDNKNQPVFEIVPKKSFGNLKFGDSRKIVENKLKPILKNKCYCKDDSNNTIFNCIECLNEPLDFHFYDDKFDGIRWSGFGFIKYKNKVLINEKTNINEIKKIFPGGKIKNVSIDGITFRYYAEKYAIILEFIPIQLICYYNLDKVKKIKNNFRYPYCFNNKYAYKYYNCYVLTSMYMAKDKETAFEVGYSR